VVVFAANSSTQLKITSTDEGIRLYTFVSYYNELLQVTWHYKWVYTICFFLVLCFTQCSALHEFSVSLSFAGILQLPSLTV